MTQTYKFESPHRKVTVKVEETDERVDFTIECDHKGSYPDNKAIDDWLRIVINTHIKPLDTRRLAFHDEGMSLDVYTSAA